MAINRKALFDEIRSALAPRPLTQATVDRIGAIIDAGERLPVPQPPPPDIPKSIEPPPREKTFAEKFADLFRPKGT